MSLAGVMTGPQHTEKRIVNKIGALSGNFSSVLFAFHFGHPAIESMLKTITGRMGIARQIGLLMMQTVSGNPGYRRAHQGKVSTGDKEVHNKLRNFERLVSQKSVITESNTLTVEKERSHKPRSENTKVV